MKVHVRDLVGLSEPLGPRCLVFRDRDVDSVIAACPKRTALVRHVHHVQLSSIQLGDNKFRLNRYDTAWAYFLAAKVFNRVAILFEQLSGFVLDLKPSLDAKDRHGYSIPS